MTASSISFKSNSINHEGKNDINQIVSEINFALNQAYSKDKISNLIWEIIKESGIQTYHSKRDILQSTYKTSKKIFSKNYDALKQKFEDYNNYGFRNEWDKDKIKLSKYISKTPERSIHFGRITKDKYLEFQNGFLRKSKEEKLELISVGLMCLLIFFASAGGEDFEGGIPDTDLKLGIGVHRNIISHSIVMGAIVEFLMRSGVEIINTIYNFLPEDHHIFWDNANRYINKHKGVAIGAMWAGISVHLLKDSAIFNSRTKPYVGIPFEMSMQGHQNLFFTNGAVAGVFGIKNKI